MFVSYDDWTIKTPFVSYSDKDFIEEYKYKYKNKNENAREKEYTRKPEYAVVDYFVRRNRLNKWRNVSKVVIHFININRKNKEKEGEKKE